MQSNVKNSMESKSYVEKISLQEYNGHMYFGPYTSLKAIYTGFHGCLGVKVGDGKVYRPEVCETVNIKMRKLHLIQKTIKY